MAKTVKARFENTDAAKYAGGLIRSQNNDIKYEIHPVSSDGYYSYNGVYPFSPPGDNLRMNIFYPIFPENSTLSDIEQNRAAIIEIRCGEENKGKITAQLIQLGGRIISE